MSVEVMSMVFKRYPAGGGERLLALALADHAHDDGSRIFPSVALLAQKTVQSDRTVQYQLRKMERMGWLIRVSDSSGGRGNTTEYCINPEWIKGANFAPFTPEKRVQSTTKRVQSDAQKGAIAVAPEPSITIKEPSDARAGAREAVQPEKANQGEIRWDTKQAIFINIDDEQWKRWEEAFPKLDVDAELLRIERWYADNQKKRKRNVQRFIGNWLARAFKDMQAKPNPKPKAFERHDALPGAAQPGRGT
jgi:hypothetical protein